MVPATSGSLSGKLPNGDLIIKTSGVDKGNLQLRDITRIDNSGESYDRKTPSAEALLHARIYSRFPDVSTVLHAHSLTSTVLSQLSTETVALSGYELLKGFPNIDSHDIQIKVPVFKNDQRISRFAELVDKYMDKNTDIVAYLIAGHGFYTWGHTIRQALY